MGGAKKVRTPAWAVRDVSQADFDKKLEELVSKMSTAELLATPGIYEILSEELNNEVLKAIEDDLDYEAQSGNG